MKRKFHIENLSEKLLVGLNRQFSLLNNDVSGLWSSFMPRRAEINHTVSSNLYYARVYDQAYFENFNPANEFEAWALAEVDKIEKIPDGMNSFILEAGKYAVFIHQGANTNSATFEYIFSQWLPNSGYTLDQRPHFDLLGAKYRNNDPQSEEEIWIPIK